jgi:Flp pilus assembly protein TadD
VEVYVFMFRPRSLVVAIFVVGLGATSLYAGDLRLPLPKKSKYTPVQKLNRDGVSAVEKHQFDKAKKLFYKAYLIDPNDPFTLNNLGYLAEIEGESDRAQRFYQLASEQNSDAVIDKASNDLVEGKPVSAVAGNAEEKGIRINRLNNQAIALLEKDRAPEADLVLQKALTIDARNPFTLNNLGYAKEKEGELDAAYQFYTAAANTNSRERVEVALDKDWRGKEISSVASNNAKKLNRRLRDANDVESRVAILNLRGVSAMNRNDRRAARDFIQQAYKLDPENAFTLNNMGFLAEMDGDRETADYYYDRARDGNRSGARITLATRKDVEGKKIGDLAENTDNQVLTKIATDQQARQRQGGPVMLYRRDKTPVVEPLQPVTPPQQYRVSDANGNLILPPRENTDASQPIRQGGGLAMPLPDNQQPTTIHQGQTDGGMIMPLPDDQQPGSQPRQNPPQQKQGATDGGMIMPLPDDQQPGAQPQTQQPPQQQKQGNIDNGMIMPLPDDQQPGAQQQTPQQPVTQQPAVSQPYSQPTTNTAPQTYSPPATTAAPSQTPVQPPAPPATQTAPQTQQQQPQQQQQGPGLLLPPPDSQLPQNQRPQTQAAPQNNTGVAAPPKKISDTDPAKPKPSTAKPATPNGVKKITDQD